MPSHNRHIPPFPPPLKKYLYIAEWERDWDVLPQEHTTTPPNLHPDGSQTLSLTNPTLTLDGSPEHTLTVTPTLTLTGTIPPAVPPP